MDKNTLFYISATNLGYLVMSFPTLATIISVIWSIFFDFYGSTATHCRFTGCFGPVLFLGSSFVQILSKDVGISEVINVLPTVSAAIGRSPQQYIWRVLISLHAAPRFLYATAYYGWYKQVDIGQQQTIYMWLAKLTVMLHITENFMLVLLTCVSSNDNKDIHENSFIGFIVTSWLYMLLTIALSRWVQTKAAIRTSPMDITSYRYKKFMAAINISSFSLATYFYLRHNWYCEPYVYTLFALCEYITIFTNIGFHGTAVIDFRDYSAGVVLTDLISKIR